MKDNNNNPLIDLVSVAIVVFSMFGAIHAVDIITASEADAVIKTIGCAIPGAIMFIDATLLFLIATGRFFTEIDD